MKIDLPSLIMKSQGAKRTLASFFGAVGVGMGYFPALAPYSEIVLTIAGYLGFVGIAHASIASISE